MNPARKNKERLKEAVRKDVSGLERQELEKGSWVRASALLGTLGLVFVLPVVGGAYLGDYLDRRLEGFSFNWTMSLIFLGILVGAFNVYHILRERR